MTTLSTRWARPQASVPSAAVVPLVILVVAVAEYVGNSLALWWVTLLAGIVVGWFGRRSTVLALAAGTVIAWGVGMLIQSGGRTIDVAGMVSALAINARDLGWLVVVVTFVYALLLALSGAWLGGAAHRMFRTDSAAPATPAAETVEPTPEPVEEASNV